MKPRVPPWYLGLVGAAAAQRAAELLRSMGNERAMRGSRPRERAAGRFALMVAVHVGLFTLPLGEVALGLARPRHPRRWIAAWCGATALRWWAIATLGRQWNVRGVVAEELHPVTGGPYRLVRHPNYVAVASEMVTLPMAGGAWRSALVLTALDTLVLWDRIRVEEARLEQSDGYRRAFAGRKRFIPGVF